MEVLGSRRLSGLIVSRVRLPMKRLRSKQIPPPTPIGSLQKIAQVWFDDSFGFPVCAKENVTLID